MRRTEAPRPAATGDDGWMDAAGTRHPRSAGPARIVSLVPSITELLCDLGLGGQLVGRTGFCIHPRAHVRTIPKVGGTKDVDLDRVRALAPTHVVVNVDENRRETAQALAEFVPHVIVTHPLGPEDNPPLFRLLGGIFGRSEAAEQLCAAYATAVAHRVAPITPRKVLYLIWRRPWMTVSRDTYISRTLAAFGWLTEPAGSAARYPEITLEDFAGAVDLVLLSTEPYSFRARHVEEIVGALPQAEVRLIDGEMTSWYGSRAIRGMSYLDAFARSVRASEAA